MRRIIIENKSENITDADACGLVAVVIKQGRISNDGKQYCYGTVIDYGLDGIKAMVATTANKGSDKFYVTDYR